MSIFNSVPVKIPRRSRHNLSFGNRLSGKFGRLYPVLCRKVVPGDRFNLRSQTFSQFATMATKVYQDFVLKQETFFVPSRLLWENFEKFFSLDDDSDSYIHPFVNYRSIVLQAQAFHGSLFDYFNLPTFWYPVSPANWNIANIKDYDWSGHTDDYRRITSIEAQDPDAYFIDALPFIAMFKVYCEYYCNENLESLLNHEMYDWDYYYKQIQNHLVNNNGDLTNWVLQNIAQIWNLGRLNRNYPKDYFTGSLPFAQKGPTVNVPFTGQGNVSFYTSTSVYAPERPVLSVGSNPQVINPDNPNESQIAIGVADGQGQFYSPINNRVTFKNGLTSIEDLRSAIMLQEFYEKQARSGTRYKETILAHFGVLNKDSRLQRAQFIQGVSTDLNMGNVYSTSANSDGSGITGEPVSIINGAGLSGRRKFRSYEHGYLLSFVSVYPRASYYKGIFKEWRELDKFQYFWPDFQHLGEQDVEVSEISIGNYQYGMINPGQLDNETFGYNPRYSQYKVAFNQIHGDFREARKAMTAARDFLPPIALNRDFIKINADYNNLNRVFNYTGDDYDKFDIDIYQQIIASRPMSYYGVPRFF